MSVVVNHLLMLDYHFDWFLRFELTVLMQTLSTLGMKIDSMTCTQMDRAHEADVNWKQNIYLNWALEMDVDWAR